MRRILILGGVLILIAPLSGCRHRLRTFYRETDWDSVVPNVLGWGVESAFACLPTPTELSPRAETPERKPERIVRAEKVEKAEKAEAAPTAHAHDSPNDHP